MSAWHHTSAGPRKWRPLCCEQRYIWSGVSWLTYAWKKVFKRYGEAEVIHGVDLHIEDGEFAVFVGPSGCGKSTLLRMISGLEEISEGDLQIGGQQMNDIPPAKRGIAMVFQSYALYPHLTARGNLEFGLKLQGVSKEERDERVQKAADILQITDLLERRPKDMSGGQRQRVAIGRAIVRDPSVFLFDEPLSNLDAKLRVQMRQELAELHGRLKTTMIYVTHDQVEAMTMADKIVVLQDGYVEQVGAPLDLYHRPRNRFVAGFIGSPGMNFLSATATGSGTAMCSCQVVSVCQYRWLTAKVRQVMFPWAFVPNICAFQVMRARAQF